MPSFSIFIVAVLAVALAILCAWRWYVAATLARSLVRREKSIIAELGTCKQRLAHCRQRLVAAEAEKAKRELDGASDSELLERANDLFPGGAEE